MTKSNTKKAIVLVASVAALGLMMSTVPTWYELQDNGVYHCTSNGDTAAFCMNTLNPQDSYEQSYAKPEFTNGEYHEFNASGMRTCVVLRKGNIYAPDTLCGSSVTDTAEFLANGTLSTQ